ncbi:tRNA/rRNA methyltransferase SpoU [Candidatus Magnetoovum chiemensis]|nr:tRNA/rRNA methyltransferase SpoU [Candidatus Magnetoovum chiemensis]
MITSLSNPIIKEAVKIRKESRSYNNQAFFLIEGKRIVKTAMSAQNVNLKTIFHTADFFIKNKHLIDNLSKKAQNIFEVSDKVMDKISDTKSPPGIAGIVSMDQLRLSDIDLTAARFIVFCDRIKEPGNLGAIIRSADAFGCDAVIVGKESAHPCSSKVVRASAGSVLNKPIIIASFFDFYKYVKPNGFKLIVSSPKAKTSIYDAKLELPLIVVFGEEASGVSEEVKKYADFDIFIPMSGNADSLNVAQACSIFLYEINRQVLKS